MMAHEHFAQDRKSKSALVLGISTTVIQRYQYRSVIMIFILQLIKKNMKMD